MIHKLYSTIVAVVITLATGSQIHAAAMAVKLAEAGKALMPVVVSPQASQREKDAAATLAQYLGRIASTTFDVAVGDGAAGGIIIGTAASFPALAGDVPANPTDITRREDYLLRTHDKGVHLIGATELAVEHAVWDFLHRLGHRQYFPSETWEIVPNSPTLSVAVEAREHPDYYSRLIWTAYRWKDSDLSAVNVWAARNRATAGMRLKTGHAYGEIIARNKAEFDKHPEYYAMVNGERYINPQAKFCISNDGLRRLVVDHAIRTFEQDPTADSISVDPSDGARWCECEPCAQMGSVSDRVTLLANDVAEAVNAKLAAQHGDKYVGFYAYNMHSPPPSVKAHPKVVVSVATAFVQGGFSVDELMDRWQKQGAIIGMREYHSVGWWDRHFPAAGRATRFDYLARTIPHFHENGARFYSSQMTNNWGAAGLGYYLTTRILWDLDEAARVDSIAEEFLDKCFGPAKAPMREFYGLLHSGLSFSQSRPFSTDFLGRMYRSLGAAMKLAGDDERVRARLYDLVVYTRFVELSNAVQNGPPEELNQAVEDLIRFAYRTRERLITDAIAVYRPRAWVRGHPIPKENLWNSPAHDKDGNVVNTWKINPPVELAELDGYLREGIERNKLFTFEPVAFSEDLVPAGSIGTLPAPPKPERYVKTLRGTQNFYRYATQANEPIDLSLAAGFNYANRGSAVVKVYLGEDKGETEDDAEQGDGQVSVALHQTEVPPDQQPRAIGFNVPRPGLYRIEVTDRMMTSQPTWTSGRPMTMPSSLTEFPAFNARWGLCFYVPKGTRSIGAFTSGRGVIYDSAGNAVHTLSGQPEYIDIPVPPDQAGTIWALESINGARLSLMTVPPYMARSPEELLLPREVVERDTAQKPE